VRNSLALTIFKLNSKKINDNHFFTTIIEALELIELGINNKFSNLFVKTHNLFDFLIEYLLLIINDNKISITEEFSKFLSKLLEKIYNLLKINFLSIMNNSDNNNNYFILYKGLKLVKKLNINSSELLLFNDKVITLIENYVSSKDILVELKNLSRVPYFYKFIKNSLMLICHSDKFEVKQKLFDNLTSNFYKLNFELEHEELYLYLIKTQAKLFLKPNIDLIYMIKQDGIMKHIEIFSKLLKYIEHNLKEFKSIMSQEIILELLNLFTGLIKKYPKRTIIVKSLLSLSSLFLLEVFTEININNNILNILSSMFELIFEFVNSKHDDQTRQNAIFAFENLVQCTESYNLKSHFDKYLKVFIYILNDEHPEIRDIASCVFLKFNKFNKLIPNLDNPSYTTDYLFSKMINIFKHLNEMDGDLKTLFCNFYFFLLNENFYVDKLHLNTENKVFYFEPDNRYIDNIEIKFKIINFIIKNRGNEISKTILSNFDNCNKNKVVDINIAKIAILGMLEKFIDSIKNESENIIKYFTEKNKDFDIEDVRRILYKDYLA